ncbi:hypothetical protein Dgeo_1552 [Deinococcus geothermalis DSM 11300]|uniref:Uncharacterized protein n=2 Tax=Deinococcus geothermalis TaxID=68909 RepID=Q1IY37_DEIGD|nr:hypothetical protein Dgeo_1552 [Deinococcus geothermalis DSM 11300]
MRSGKRRWMTVLALAGAAGGVAGAVNLDFGVAYHSGTSGWARVGVSDLALGRGTLTLGVSNRALEASVVQGFSLPPAGTVSARLEAAVTQQGGLRLAPGVSGTLGPVALNLAGTFFTAGATEIDPLAAWTLAPTDLRASGWNADLTARYRVSRSLIALASGGFGAQNQGSLGLEWRRDLTRTLPPAAGDDPGSAPTTETLGSLALRLGTRAGQGVLGVTGGLTYRAASGLTLALDALAGPESWGVTGSLNAPDLLGEGSMFALYVADEPWRQASAPLRVGAEVTVPAGPGTLGLAVRGGQWPGRAGGVGARVSYSFPLGGTPGTP